MGLSQRFGRFPEPAGGVDVPVAEWIFPVQENEMPIHAQPDAL